MFAAAENLLEQWEQTKTAKLLARQLNIELKLSIKLKEDTVIQKPSVWLWLW